MVTIKTDKIVKEIEENYLKGKHVVGDIEKNKPEKTILGDLMYPEYTVIRAIENAIYKYNETLVEEQKKEIDKLLKIAEKVDCSMEAFISYTKALMDVEKKLFGDEEG